MALDLYAGPLSRYHSGDWKTIGQQMAEADGHRLITIHVNQPDRESGPPLPQNEVTEDVHIWQEKTYRIMQGQGMEPHRWDDSPNMEYLTDRPGWEGLSGLIFKAAHLFSPGFTPPEIVPELNTLDQDPAFQAATREPGLMQILSDCEMWIPGNFQFAFEYPTLTGVTKLISSLGLLTIALDQVCHAWGKERLQVAQMHTDQPSKNATLDDAAIHGLCMFCRLGQFALDRNLPLVLDY